MRMHGLQTYSKQFMLLLSHTHQSSYNMQYWCQIIKNKSRITADNSHFSDYTTKQQRIPECNSKNSSILCFSLFLNYFTQIRENETSQKLYI